MTPGMVGGPMWSVPSMGGQQPKGQPMFQVGDNLGAMGGQKGWPGGGAGSNVAGGGAAADYDTLQNLIVSTIQPGSWAEVGGQGSITHYDTTLSLVIRQTQKVHDEIRDLLEQLRRLQDLQVTVEVRFVTVADRFFEQIGVDFDFGVQDNVRREDIGLGIRP
jgi:general secretion pathway protein D